MTVATITFSAALAYGLIQHTVAESLFEQQLIPPRPLPFAGNTHQHTIA
jgi:hypothetical protein